MHLICDTKGISRLVLILLMLLFFAVGALFSYIYTMGFYAPSEFRLPNESVITIESVEFYDQDTSFFNVTILNPSYSPSSVEVTRIETRTPDDNKIHMITNTQPTLPYQLERGEIRTFRAMWNWANYTGINLPYTDQPIEVRVFLADKRGEILEVKRPLTMLVITDLVFNSSISVNHFNTTVQNVGSSKTYVNITEISIGGNVISMVSPSLPYSLNPGDAPKQFQCFYNWTDVQGREVTVRISTMQGYAAKRTQTLPKPVVLDILQIVFNATLSTNQFNVTVSNAADSSTYVDINRITVTVGEGAAVNISQWVADPSPRLKTNASVLIACTWDWSSFKGQTLTAKVTVYTSQGFTISKEAQIP